MTGQEPRIFSHLSPEYESIRKNMSMGKYSGAYYYSQEIVNNIIPNVKTNRPWVTVNAQGYCYDHAIVFIHNNKDLSRYAWLKAYKNLVLICSQESVAWEMLRYGQTIYLPLSVDVKYVQSFIYNGEKDETPCYVGNLWSFKTADLTHYLPEKCVTYTELPREDLLNNMARYKTVYAVGRCAIEAKILGAEIGVCDSRFPDPSIWEVIDNKDAATWLQHYLNQIDGGKA